MRLKIRLLVEVCSNIEGDLQYVPHFNPDILVALVKSGDFGVIFWGKLAQKHRQIIS